MTTIVQATVQTVMFSPREHNRVMNECHRETMEQIKTIYLPFHFMTAAFNRYPGVFKKRAKKYMILKARLKGHQNPNVWSGALRAAALVDSKPRATAYRGTLEIKAPMETVIQYGKWKGKTIRRPLTEERRLEMEYVSPEEIDQQCERIRNQYVSEIYNPARQSKVLKQFR